MPSDAELFYQTGQPYLGPAPLDAARPAKKRYQAPTRYLERPDAIVIGSGIGGLGVASLLAQRRGAKVLVLEANIVPGGCTHVHEIDGFEFPSGVDSIGDMDPRVGRKVNRPNIDYITGGQLRWAKMPDMHETVTFGDDTYEWFSSMEKNIEWIERRFPGEGKKARAYYDLEDHVERRAAAWALTKVYPAWTPESVREAAYRLIGSPWRRYMHRSLGAVLKGELGFSHRLASVLGYMYGNLGQVPDRCPFAAYAMVLFHYRYGAYFPVGGPGQIPECIVPIIEAAGGQVATHSPVERILVENGRAVGVRLGNGEEIRSKLVISDAGSWNTFVELLDPEISASLGYPRKYEQLEASPPHLYLMLGYDEPIELPKPIVWHMPYFEGQDPYDITGNDRRFKDSMEFAGMPGYILSPSARDPLHAQRYPGQSTVMVLAEGAHEWVARCKRDPGFRAAFEAGATESMTAMAKRHIPALRGKTPKVVRAGVPIGCNPRSWKGSSYGVDISGDRWTKHTHWLRPKTKIEGLYLTGQDAFAPGMAGAALGARMTYVAVTGDVLALLTLGESPVASAKLLPSRTERPSPQAA